MLSLAGSGFASTTATITVTADGQPGDTNVITVLFNGFTETVRYGPFSTPASIASALAAMFSRDYLQAGLCANASGPVINLKLRGGGAFGVLNVTGPSSTFLLSPSGFDSQGQGGAVAGTATLTVNGTLAAQTSYGQNSTPGTVAAGLAAGISSDSPVNITAAGDTLDLVAKTPGGNSNLPYTIQFPNGATINGNLEGGSDGSGTQQPVYNSAYGYDAASNLQSSTDSVMGTWSMTGGYDSLNRLTAASSSAGPYAGQSLCWAYDAFGNRTAQVLQSASCPASLSPTVSYNGNNQITWVQDSAPNGFTYDAAGNVTVDNVNNYLYDGEGRICAVQNRTVGTMVGYIYDAEGNRVSKGLITAWSCDPSQNGFRATSAFVLGQNGEQVTEMAMDPGSGTMQWRDTNVWANGSLIGTYDSNGLHFYLDDLVGSRRVQTNYQGGIEQTCTSLPYGDGESCSPTPTEHLFTGKERDSESGNDYFGARYYTSSVGRFLSPDFETLPDTVPYADFSNPQTLNLYSYGGNSPISSVDANGHDVNVCTTGSNGAHLCTLMSNDQYAAAQNADNGGLNVPSLNTVGTNGSANITDANGNAVGTATYVPSNPGIDPFVGNNEAGYNLLRAANRTVSYATAGARMAYGGAFLAPLVVNGLAGMGSSVIGLGIASGPALFGAGQMFEHYFETSSGEVGFLAEVETSGSTLILKDVAVYPTGTLGSLNVGTGQVMQALHQLESMARSPNCRSLELV